MKLKQIGNYTGNIITTVLANRGVNDVELLMNPNNLNAVDSSKFRNINEGAKLFVSHLSVGNKIGILIDSDVDGFTSSSIMYQYIKKIAVDANIQLFFHDKKAHGLTEEITDIIINSDVDLLIVADAGSNDDENIKKLVFMGTDVLIIDHHEIENYPSQGVLINNQDKENEETNKNLVGAGMVYKFCEYVDTFFRDKYAHDFYDLVAIGQIGDSSDISDNEIRNYVFTGLRDIKNPFIQFMVNQFSEDFTDATPKDLSFSIIPLFNAVIRVGSMDDKRLLFRALSDIDSDECWTVEKRKKNKKTGKFDKLTIVQNLYEYTFDICKRNKTSQTSIIKKTLEKIKNTKVQGGIIIHVIPSDSEGATMGLIANKIAQKERTPTLILKQIIEDDGVYYVGSGRGYEYLLPSLKDWCKDTGLVEFAQGHPNAFGVKIKEENFDEFTMKTFGLYYDADSTYLVDYIQDGKVNVDMLEEIIEKKYLFGGKVKEPLLAFTNIRCNKEYISRKGSMITFYAEGVEFVKFDSNTYDCDDIFMGFGQGVTMNFVGTVGKVNYSGKEKIRVILSDFKNGEIYNKNNNNLTIKEKITAQSIVF